MILFFLFSNVLKIQKQSDLSQYSIDNPDKGLIDNYIEVSKDRFP